MPKMPSKHLAKRNFFSAQTSASLSLVFVAAINTRFYSYNWQERIPAFLPRLQRATTPHSRPCRAAPPNPPPLPPSLRVLEWSGRKNGNPSGTSVDPSIFFDPNMPSCAVYSGPQTTCFCPPNIHLPLMCFW